MDLNLARALARVVESESFAAAARTLGLPEASVRRAVAQLEEWLGTRLFERRSGRPKLTTHGRAYYHLAARALAELAEAEHAVAETQGELRGLVRLIAPSEMSRSFLPGMVMRFMAEHRAIEVDVSFSNRDGDLVSERFDLALQLGRPPHSKRIARRVGRMGGWLFAAPDYVRSHPLLWSPNDLKKHKCIVQSSPGDGDRIWPLVGPRGPEPVGVTAAVNSDDILFTHELALRCAGIALLPAMLGIDNLWTGTLVRVLPEYEVPGPDLHLLLSSTSPPPRRVALFCEALVEALTTPNHEPLSPQEKPCARAGEG
jgi:DNA-binding transcriptional LysR family regulator